MTAKTSTSANMWLWMGAAISIAEIMNGAMLAPLGIEKGLLAGLAGRLVGLFFLGMAGYIGAANGLNAMESVQVSFGPEGRKFFSFLNVLQLVGWTAVMIFNGASAVNQLLGQTGETGTVIGCVGIGALILLWLFLDLNQLAKVNSIAVLALTICCAWVTWHILGWSAPVPEPAAGADSSVSFGLAVELSLAMPLSWIPLIADYNKEAANPIKANWTGSLIYVLGSFWMSAIGLVGGVYTGLTDVSALMAGMGLGMAVFFVIVFSTVTTTYLDVKSAAISYHSIVSAPGKKAVSFVVIVLGVLIAIGADADLYMNFLYYIGSCFAPMVAILITDYFLLGKKEIAHSLNLVNAVLWAWGFVFYRYLIALSEEGFDPVVGISIPVLVSVMAVTFAVGKVQQAVSAGRE